MSHYNLSLSAEYNQNNSPISIIDELFVIIFVTQLLTIAKIIILNLKIGSCLACVYRVMDARGKFGEHEGSLRADLLDTILRHATSLRQAYDISCFV